MVNRSRSDRLKELADRLVVLAALALPLLLVACKRGGY